YDVFDWAEDHPNVLRFDPSLHEEGGNPPHMGSGSLLPLGDRCESQFHLTVFPCLYLLLQPPPFGLDLIELGKRLTSSCEQLEIAQTAEFSATGAESMDPLCSLQDVYERVHGSCRGTSVSTKERRPASTA